MFLVGSVLVVTLVAFCLSVSTSLLVSTKTTDWCVSVCLCVFVSLCLCEGLCQLLYLMYMSTVPRTCRVEYMYGVQVLSTAVHHTQYRKYCILYSVLVL